MAAQFEAAVEGLQVAGIRSSDLERLSTSISRDISSDLGTRVSGRLETIASSLNDQVKTTVKTTVRAVVGEPSPTYSGFLSISIENEGEATYTDSGNVEAQAGTVVRFLIAIVLDSRAAHVQASRSRPGEDLLVVQPINMVGEQTALSVPFDIVAESSTLLPSPNRARCLVPGTSSGGSQSVSVEMPADRKIFQLWIQLFQAGRLVQAVTLNLKAA